GRDRRSVELLVEISVAAISDAVQTTADLFEEPRSGEFATANAGMVSGWAAELLDRTGSQVPVLTDELKDRVVRRNHPFSTLAHIIRLCDHSHTSTASFACTTY